MCRWICCNMRRRVAASRCSVTLAGMGTLQYALFYCRSSWPLNITWAPRGRSSRSPIMRAVQGRATARAARLPCIDVALTTVCCAAPRSTRPGTALARQCAGLSHSANVYVLSRRCWSEPAESALMTALLCTCRSAWLASALPRRRHTCSDTIRYHCE